MLSGCSCTVHVCTLRVDPGCCAIKTGRLAISSSSAPPQPTSKESLQAILPACEASAASPPRPLWPNSRRATQQSHRPIASGCNSRYYKRCTKVETALASTTHLHIALLQGSFGGCQDLDNPTPLGCHLCKTRCCGFPKSAVPQYRFSRFHLIIIIIITRHAQLSHGSPDSTCMQDTMFRSTHGKEEGSWQWW
jgi:hypothetical protein